MKTKVSNCGKYECVHCNSEGQCMVSLISLDQDGKCIIFRPTAGKILATKEKIDEILEHTNMC